MNDSVDKSYDYAILGFGAAGIHLVLALINDPYYKLKKILIIDQEIKNSNDRTWCFWDKKHVESPYSLQKTWDYISVQSNRNKLQLDISPYSYRMVRSKSFYEYARQKIADFPNIDFVQESVVKTEESDNEVVISCTKSRFISQFVFSSIVHKDLQLDDHPTLFQHFGGWFIRTNRHTFNTSIPEFMNFDIAQDNETRFTYELPYSDKEALIEYTIFSKNIRQQEFYDDFLDDYIKNKLKIDEFEIIEKEYGVIPMTSYPFQTHNSKRILHIGTAGGWTKSSTGYTFYLSKKYAGQLSSFLKNNDDMREFSIGGRHAFLDKILLQVLTDYNSLGHTIFYQMFKKNPVHRIFRFLNNESSLIDDFLIIFNTKYPFLFIKSFLKTILKK